MGYIDEANAFDLGSASIIRRLIIELRVTPVFQGEIFARFKAKMMR